jgi:tetratricopeptide (TPR) repeat protein
MAVTPASAEQLLFAEALPIVDPQARAAYLAEECGNDAALLARVQRLLRASENAGDFLEEPPTALHGLAEADPLANELGDNTGERIGRYKLLEKIGEGGCGVVYLAEQEEPVRRRVALKIIKLGMDTRSVVARLEAERQALALMDHPHIAKVLDGGATPTGRPYFVMELVRGVRITDFCDEMELSTEARLRLFIQVCQAIQHAHQKGIIHRDLKPSNILVTVNDGVPVPKVIDFGIAKAIGQRLTDKTLFTQFHSFIGTPAYVSPEQVEITSVDIDTRSDIYSLGVLLYELLTGDTPFDGNDLVRSGLDAMRRTIREQDPIRPSTRLTQLVGADVRRLSSKSERRIGAAAQSAIDTDLDWIVMKCLEKDRARRYATANGLASDVQRHLDHEPIVARPPGKLYRFRKLVQRHRAAFAAVFAVAAALIAGAVLSTWQALRAEKGEARATAALAALRATAPAFAAQARELAARGQFAEAIDKLDYAITLCPDCTEYLLGKGNLFQSQFQFGEAARSYRSVLRINPADAWTRRNLILSERLEQRENISPTEWENTLGELLVQMVSEQRSDSELKEIKARLFEISKKRIASLRISNANSLEQRLTVRPGNLFSLDLRDTDLSDLSPLHGLALDWLDLAGCPVSDLNPLRGMPLGQLNLASTRVTDLQPIRDLKELRVLSLYACTVSNLSFLEGLQLVWLDLNATPVADLTPLRGMPIRALTLRNTRVTDLGPLAGMPLTDLDCTSIPAFDFSSLANCATLEVLHLTASAVKTLDPFRKCKLQTLRMNNTAIADLSPVAGMPLSLICFFESSVTDVAPLSQCANLQRIGLAEHALKIEPLRGLTNLLRISYRADQNGEPAESAAEFWRADLKTVNAK